MFDGIAGAGRMLCKDCNNEAVETARGSGALAGTGTNGFGVFPSTPLFASEARRSVVFKVGARKGSGWDCTGVDCK